jgi:chaperonin GroES
MAAKDANKINITPLGDRVLIKPEINDGKEKKSAAGIIIPVGADEDKVDRGTVIALGEGRVDSKGDLVPMNVKVGNKVLFQWGDKVKIDGEEYFVVSETSILAIIK